MAKIDTQLTKQVGEYLVAAELARRGLLSATFAGSVRHYDVIASGPTGGHVPIQVKTINGGAWQLDIRDFVEVAMDGNRQIVGAPKPAPYAKLVYVFVALQAYGSDRFFILAYEPLRDLLLDGYKGYLARNREVRPKNPRSFHTALKPQSLAEFRDCWDTILQRVTHVA